MTEQIIEVEAESLGEAREQIKSRIPEGLHLLSEQVISDGKPKTVKAAADTTEEAFANARGQIPGNANILEERELIAPDRTVITIEAFDEQSAKIKINIGIVKSLKLKSVGKKGFLGIGRKPNRYEVEVLRQASVEITYVTKAKISATIGEKRETQASGSLLASLLAEPLIAMVASRLETEKLLPGEFRVKIVESYYQAVQSIKFGKILGTADKDMLNLAVIVSVQDDGSHMFLAEDGDGRQFDLNTLREPALLLMASVTLSELQRSRKLWSRVKNLEDLKQ